MKFKFAEELCTECQVCELACSAVKDGNYSLKQSRIHIRSSSKRGKTKIIVCRQCRKCKCVEACPYNAFTKNEETGGVSIGPDCQACLACIDACPFGAVSLDPKNNLPMVCDLCGGRPSCVAVCSRGAIQERPHAE